MAQMSANQSTCNSTPFSICELIWDRNLEIWLAIMLMAQKVLTSLARNETTNALQFWEASFLEIG